MLWYRYWLETRARMIFVVVWSMFFFGVGLYQVAIRPNVAADQLTRAFLNQTTFIAFLAAGMLAGSGVRTQTFGRNYRGVHGSVHFTLSLPVSRSRLLLTRMALGLAETIVVVLFLSIAAWAFIGAARMQAGISAVILHAVFVALAGAGVVGGLAVLTSTVFDDTVQMWVVSGAIMVLFAFRAQLPRWLDVMGAVIEGSPLVADTVAWPIVAAAMVAGGLCVLTAARVVAVQEV
jgi:hypothetical protein